MNLIYDQGSSLKLKKFLEQKYGGLDVLINNRLYDAISIAEVTMRTNFWGTLWVCHALLPILRHNARVVNVSSFVSKKSLDQLFNLFLCLSLDRFRNKDLIQARVLTETRPGDGILLNACCPGWVRTDMAGPNATKSPEEGAETPVCLAMLPEGAKEPHGQLVWDKTVQEW
uniref:Carbonyl reductase 1 n=1 Tax=Sinocyclocheilus anshuiensis TaxID=1608454 RepID=A0A671LU56_9TELE